MSQRVAELRPALRRTHYQHAVLTGIVFLCHRLDKKQVVDFQVVATGSTTYWQA